MEAKNKKRMLPMWRKRSKENKDTWVHVRAGRPHPAQHVRGCACMQHNCHPMNTCTHTHMQNEVGHSPRGKTGGGGETGQNPVCLQANRKRGACQSKDQKRGTANARKTHTIWHEPRDTCVRVHSCHDDNEA